MSDHQPANEARRRFLKTTALAAAALALAGIAVPEIRAEGEAPHLTDADPTAKAMDYVEDATTSKNKLYQPGSTCANCQFYSGATTGYGNCQIFPGKLVNAQGWCTSYTKKGA